jgi:hypothetical protein
VAQITLQDRGRFEELLERHVPEKRGSLAMERVLSQARPDTADVELTEHQWKAVFDYARNRMQAAVEVGTILFESVQHMRSAGYLTDDAAVARFLDKSRDALWGAVHSRFPGNLSNEVAGLGAQDCDTLLDRIGDDECSAAWTISAPRRPHRSAGLPC